MFEWDQRIHRLFISSTCQVPILIEKVQISNLHFHNWAAWSGGGMLVKRNTPTVLEQDKFSAAQGNTKKAIYKLHGHTYNL